MLPATIDLAGSEVHLVGRDRPRARGRPRARAGAGTASTSVLIDCPPSLGILTINGLTAADDVLIPLQCETLSHRGVGQLLETVADVRAYTQPDLQRPRRGRDDVRRPDAPHVARCSTTSRRAYGLAVLQPPIPKSVRFAEAPATGQSILDHAPTSPARTPTASSRTAPRDARQRRAASPAE